MFIRKLVVEEDFIGEELGLKYSLMRQNGHGMVADLRFDKCTVMRWKR